MKVTVYERHKNEKGDAVEASHSMWPVDAREAVRNDPDRYSMAPLQAHKAVKRSDGTYAVELHGKEIKDGLSKAEATKLASELDAA
jgi:hypothetical protein